MNLPKYPFTSSNRQMTFEFTSEGPKGLIHKLIHFQRIGIGIVFNLAFGDKEPAGRQINDTITSNNGDGEKVLATVVATIYAFTDKYPHYWIYVTGSTQSRTRLYRMGISKYYHEVIDDFEVLGDREGEWEVFKFNVEYEGFLIRRLKKY